MELEATIAPRLPVESGMQVDPAEARQSGRESRKVAPGPRGERARNTGRGGRGSRKRAAEPGGERARNTSRCGFVLMLGVREVEGGAMAAHKLGGEVRFAGSVGGGQVAPDAERQPVPPACLRVAGDVGLIAAVHLSPI